MVSAENVNVYKYDPQRNMYISRLSIHL